MGQIGNGSAVEVAGALKEFARRAKITLEAHHNVTVATGRPDSVYSNVIVEYKDPGTLSGNRDAANNKKLIEQIRQRFYDMRREENRSMNSMFGVGTDGKYFVFCPLPGRQMDRPGAAGGQPVFDGAVSLGAL